MEGFHRRRSRTRRGRPGERPDPDPGRPALQPPSPADLAARPGRAAGPTAVTTPVVDPDVEVVRDAGPVRPLPEPPARRAPDDGSGRRNGPSPRTAPDDRELERGLRGLVGSGSSQVATSAAMRARDAARPTDADLAAAEAELVIVRRHWVPREALPRPNRQRR